MLRGGLQGQGGMRFLWLILGALALAQCATPGAPDFVVGEDPGAFVIIGVAEAQQHTSPRYIVLWRRLDEDGAFSSYGPRRIFEARTHERGSVRVSGIPGEFIMSEIEPGEYALDSVYAIIRDRRVNYVANGVVEGPERPAFTVRPGEAIYLGIWQTDLEDVTAVARPWRLDEADLRAALNRSDPVRGPVRVRETHTRSVRCAPHKLTTTSQRQVC